MKKLTYLLLLLAFVACNQTAYQTTDNGIIVNIKKNGEKIRLIVYNNEVVRVSITKPNSDFSTDKSLMVVATPNKSTRYNVEEKEDCIILSTSEISVTVKKENGKIEFFDKDGNPMLCEKDDARKYGKNVDKSMPETCFQDIFVSPDDEAFYGLGQHQNGEVNYKGLDVELMQNNIVAVVPFLYSNKKYGLLWDNYSITRFGDPRDYEPISNMKVYDTEGNDGEFTTSYYSKNKLFTTRTEPSINYATLTEQKNFPEGYTVDRNSKIIWEGYIQPNTAGTHKFKLWASGYYKVWIDGKLIMNEWRQNWNPWYYKFSLDMNPEKKYHLKVEWKPDATDAYINLVFLDAAYAADQQNLSLASEAGKEIDYYFITGKNSDEIISGYRNLTGKAPIMPKWVMGLWQSREHYKTQKEITDIVKEYRKRQIPLDNIVLDWNYWPTDYWGDHNFDSIRFPNPTQMVKDIHNMHTNIMISVWPKFYTTTQNYKEMEANGWMLTHNVELGNLDWIGHGYLNGFYDAFNPEARTFYWKSMNEKLFSKGIDAWWLDATEPDMHSNVKLEEKKASLSPNYLGSGEEFFNAYSLEHTKGVYEGQRATDASKRVFILTRSMFAGQQRYSAATWSGDVASRWIDLRNQLAAGINVGLSGIPYWTTDIGGFSVEERYRLQNPKHIKEWRELNLRWYQFGAFCPLFRIHGQFPYREIWELAPVGTKEYNSFIYYDKLRYSLMPYIYSLAGETYHKNYTIMRGLVMDFGNDSNVENINNQFMFGPAIMVCPIGHFKQYTREVYLPDATIWYDYYTNEKINGGQTIKANAPIERIPLYIKAGSIIPYGPEVQYSTQPTDGTIYVTVYTGANGNFELYEDENINYNYENGDFSFIPFTFNEEDGTLTIGKRQGSFQSMKIERKIGITFIDEKTSNKNKVNAQPMKTVNYNGEEIIINK